MEITILVILLLSIPIWVWFTRKDKKFFSLLISFLSVLVLVSAGIFTYLKYEDYRKESNYEKVITRYVDKNIDVTNSEMSQYIMSVIANIQLCSDDKYPRNAKEQRKEMYTSSLKNAQPLIASFIKLSVIDCAVHASYIKVFNETNATMRSIVEEDVNKEEVGKRLVLIEYFYRFVTLNLQDVGELIIRDSNKYDVPNIEIIKNEKEFKAIIARYNEFNKLYDEGLSDVTKQQKLVNFVLDYLNKKGIK